jgi:hypothetical protein
MSIFNCPCACFIQNYLMDFNPMWYLGVYTKIIIQISLVEFTWSSNLISQNFSWATYCTKILIQNRKYESVHFIWKNCIHLTFIELQIKTLHTSASEVCKITRNLSAKFIFVLENTQKKFYKFPQGRIYPKPGVLQWACSITTKLPHDAVVSRIIQTNQTLPVATYKVALILCYPVQGHDCRFGHKRR